MSKSSNVMLPNGANLNSIVNLIGQQLTSQGYEVNAAVMGPNSALVTIKKDRDGFKNIIGLGIECKATLAIMGNNVMTVNVESEWTNKILAIAIGWFFCLIPFITGIVGCVSQNGLPSTVISAIQAAAASSGGSYDNNGYMGSNGYGAPNFNPNNGAYNNYGNNFNPNNGNPNQ